MNRIKKPLYISFILCYLVIIFISNCKNKSQSVNIAEDSNKVSDVDIQFNQEYYDTNIYSPQIKILCDANRPVYYEFWKDGNIHSKLLFYEDENHNIKRINPDLDPNFIIRTLWIFMIDLYERFYYFHY